MDHSSTDWTEPFSEWFPGYWPLDSGNRAFRSALQSHGPPLSKSLMWASKKVLDGGWGIFRMSLFLGLTDSP